MKIFNTTASYQEVIHTLETSGIAVFADSTTSFKSYYKNIKPHISESVHPNFTMHPTDGCLYFLRDYDKLDAKLAKEMIVTNTK